MKVVSLERKPNGHAIDALEEALALVKSGKLVSVSVSWVEDDDTIGGCFSAGPNVLLTWASMQHGCNSFYRDVVIKDDK